MQPTNDHEALVISWAPIAVMDHGPAGLRPSHFTLGPEREELWTWNPYHVKPVEGTPAGPEGQSDTVEGINVKLLKRAYNYQWKVQVAAALLVYALLQVPSITALQDLMAHPEWWHKALFIGYTLTAAFGTLWLVIPAMQRRPGKHLFQRLLQPRPEAALKWAIQRIPLADLPGEVLRSRTLWNMGLGRRLAHLTPEALEVMVRLADETSDVERLAEIADGVTS